MTARRQPRDRGKGQPDGTDGPGVKRPGRGQPASRDKWPASGKTRDWLAFYDQVRQDNGMPSLRELEMRMHFSYNRIGELLRGDGLPVHEKQARAYWRRWGRRIRRPGGESACTTRRSPSRIRPGRTRASRNGGCGPTGSPEVLPKP
jgi:hypothetical protein